VGALKPTHPPLTRSMNETSQVVQCLFNVYSTKCREKSTFAAKELKPSSRACSPGHDFNSASNAYLVTDLFSNMFLFSNSLNKTRMNGRSKLFGKNIGPHACLRENNYSSVW